MKKSRFTEEQVAFVLRQTRPESPAQEAEGNRQADVRRAWPGWAYDLVFDACADGQQIKCLSVVAAAGGPPRRQASSGRITCSARVG
jgi:hypothetical protein